MLPAPPSALIAGIEALVVGGLMLVLGFLVITVVLHLARMPDVEAVVRWGLALPGLTGLVLIFALLHIATRGWVLASGLAVWILVAIAFSVLVIVVVRLHPSPSGGRTPLAVLGALVALACILWVPPLLRLLPTMANGDITLHMGWASQILNGESVPSSPIVGDIPNYYPWLYHMGIALFSHFTPGGSPFHAINTMQVVLVGGVVMSLFALGQVMTQRVAGGVAVAVAGGLSGGFGWIVARSPVLLTNTRHEDALAYWGDLFATRSYNFAFHNVAPAFPRDLSYVLLPGMLLLVTLALLNRRAGFLVLGGIVLGCIGLSGGEAFLVALSAAVVTVLLSTEIPRSKAVAALVVPGLGLWSIWLVPLLVNLNRLGFESLANAPVVVPWWGILGGWGVVTPLAAVGLVRWSVARGDPRTKAAIALLAATAAALGAATLLPRILGEGFTTLGFHHRYWPLLCLALALFAGPGGVYLYERIRSRGPAAAAIATGMVVLIAIPSPILGSAAVGTAYPRPDTMRMGYGLLERSLRGENTVLEALRRGPNRTCTVAAPFRFGFRVFSYTGYRMLLVTRTVEEGRKAGVLERLIRQGSLTPEAAEGPHFRNLAHLRWSRIYERIPSDVERAAANLSLTTGDPDSPEWRTTTERFDVDAVVAFVGTDGDSATVADPVEIVPGPGDTEMAITWIGNCYHRS